ncbi:MAG: MarR family winged helix-turn-helix transcriptional regulator [Candidatus Sulfotelmatobacter sp.]
MQNNGQSDTSTTGPKLWVILARAHGALASYVERCIAGEGIGISDFMVLEVLLHKGPMSISSIGEKVLLANASMTAAVDRLEEKGWVVRQSAENDRRSKIVALTRQGRAFISELYARHARDIEVVTSVLTRREQDQLRSLLKKLGLSAQAASSQRGAGAMLSSSRGASPKRGTG